MPIVATATEEIRRPLEDPDRAVGKVDDAVLAAAIHGGIVAGLRAMLGDDRPSTPV